MFCGLNMNIKINISFYLCVKMFLNIFSVLVDSDMSVLFVNNGDTMNNNKLCMCILENYKDVKIAVIKLRVQIPSPKCQAKNK